MEAPKGSFVQFYRSHATRRTRWPGITSVWYDRRSKLTCIVWRANQNALGHRLRFCAEQAIIFIVYAGTVFNAIHLPPPFYIHPYDYAYDTAALNSHLL